MEDKMSREMKTQEKKQREPSLSIEEHMRRYPGRFVDMTNSAKAFVLPSVNSPEPEDYQQKIFELGEKALEVALRRNYPHPYEK